MTDKTVLTERNGRIATLRLNRPAAMNALTADMLSLLGDELEAIAGDKGISVVVLTGEGRAFTAGVDLKALRDSGQDLTEGNVGDALNGAARWVQQLIERMPQCVIAKVNGFCFTGGVELMLACDIIIAAEEAKFGDTHAMIGLRPTWGMTQRLGRKVGMQRARELSFTARTITGVEAAAYGLAMEAVPLAQLDSRVDELAQAIAKNSPGSIAAYKDLYRKSENAGLDAGLAYEYETKYEIADVRERMAEILKRLGG
ncbi:MAG: enoyl-CoA hydratase/isomerase family protein [Minwuia sp.]|uniref:enoyl-CoA hydratase/isomerase family protein n=1 Tax=Minwuia sp. TaxID=2493630 RepID=UPI003A882270